ncbi:MAG: dienelactone hydrolase, partial [Bacteroidota bacterium]
DANNTGLIGYSMGGYGALNTMGAGYSERAVQFFKGATNGSDALLQRAAGEEAYLQSFDDRIKAVVAFAPWGMNAKVWDAEGLKGLNTPTLFVAGSQDDISGYENGIKAIYDGATNADRYLLTYLNARHNVAPNPPPAVSLKKGLPLDEYLRYADSVWDQKRINNVNQHFVTAFLGQILKGDEYAKYLDLAESANAGLWEGFLPRTAVGLELRHAKAGE